MKNIIAEKNPNEVQPAHQIVSAAERVVKAVNLLRENGIPAWYTDVKVNNDGGVSFSVYLPNRDVEDLK